MLSLAGVSRWTCNGETAALYVVFHCCTNCGFFQALIKAYGRKRLKEIEDHKRKKLQAKLARRKANSNPASANCSPVHQMMNASTGLLQRVIQLGRKQSISADNLNMIGRALTTSDYKSTLKPDGSTLLERVINLGRTEQARSQNQIDRLTSNTLKPPDPYKGRPSLSCNDLPTTDDDDDGENESCLNTRHTSPYGNEPSKRRSNSSMRWGLLKGSQTGDKGNGYQAVDTDELENDTQVCVENAKESVTPMSCDQIAVIVDTEESDLELTPGSPDHVRTPLLAKSPSQDVESQTSTITSPPTPTTNAQGYEQLSSSDDRSVAKSVISDETKMTSSVAPMKRKTNAKSGEYSNTVSSSASAPAAKSLSFENPSYADVPSGEQEREESMAEDKSSAAGLLSTAHSDSTLQQRPSTLPICPSNNNAMSTTANTSGDVHGDSEMCANPNNQPSDPSYPSSTTMAKSTRLFLF